MGAEKSYFKCLMHQALVEAQGSSSEILSPNMFRKCISLFGDVITSEEAIPTITLHEKYSGGSLRLFWNKLDQFEVTGLFEVWIYEEDSRDSEVVLGYYEESMGRYRIKCFSADNLQVRSLFKVIQEIEGIFVK